MIRFALAGNPNSGKTTLFNALTGSTAHVGNWPGVTVDKKVGTYKKLSEPVQIVDLPGIYSLSPYTPEEVISRNFILDEKPEAVINIVDATNLERNLYLTTQLLEMDVPVIVALNMADELQRTNKEIDTKELEKALGVPVVSISALKETNVGDLMQVAYEAALKGREAHSVLDGSRISSLIEDVRKVYDDNGETNPLFHAIKLVENDEIEVKHHEKTLALVDAFKETFVDDVFGKDLEAVIADERYKYISKHCSKTLKLAAKIENEGADNKKKKKSEDGLTRSDRVDKILTNKWLGIPIFLVILYLAFHFIFSEHFLFLDFMGVDLGKSAVDGAFWDGALFSPGVMLTNLVNNGLGLLIEQIRGGLESIHTEAWATGLICDGILAGIFAIFGFLPQILLLYLVFSIMEDSGYMARVAFILDRIFRKFGVSGRAFLPMIMGFGCSIPAMANTRTLADEKERIATIRVIPFFSCGAKLPILAGIAGGIAQIFDVPYAGIIPFLMYVLGMVVAFIALIIMRNTSLRGEVAPFIMELPPYRTPSFKALMLHLWDKVKHFVKKAFTIILASTIFVWVLSHFNFSWQYLEDVDVSKSILAETSRLVQPLFTPLGFGTANGLTAEYGWIFTAAVVAGLIAKENVIVLFGIFGAAIMNNPAFAEEAEDVISAALIDATGANIPTLISFIAFNLLTIPCFAAVATAKGELRKGTLRWTLLFWVATSYIASTVVYTTLVAPYGWPVFIYIPLLIAIIVGLYYWNKKHPAKKDTIAL